MILWFVILIRNFRLPPNDIATWEEYFEEHFQAPTCHIGWDRSFEDHEESAPEEEFSAITEEFERSGVQSYSHISLDESLHVPSETLNNYLSENGVLLG